MSQKALGDGPDKMIAVPSRGGRIAAILGVLSAMVRRGGAERRPGLAGAVPHGVRLPAPQAVTVPGGDLRLVQ